MKFIVAYSSEKITKIGRYLPELTQNKRVSFLWPTVYVDYLL